MAISKSQLAEWAKALDSVKAAKNLFWVLIGLSILIQIGAFVAVNSFGVIDPSEYSQDGAQPTTAEAAGKTESITWWNHTLKWVLPATKFVALVAAVLLSLMLLLAVKLSLVGKLSGIDGYMSSFLWSLVLGVMLIPWQQLLNFELASGALFNLGQLKAALAQVKPAFGAQDPSRIARLLFYLRFAIYPIAALFVMLAVQVKFARGLRATLELFAPTDQEDE